MKFIFKQIYYNIYNMCVNCNLLTPITDECAELLGIEKRKYLAYGRDLNYISKDEKVEQGTTNALINFVTMYCFSFDLNTLKEKTVQKNFSTNKNQGPSSITIYEGKIKMIHPLSYISTLPNLKNNLDLIKKTSNQDGDLDFIKNIKIDDLYLECIDFTEVSSIM